MCKCGESLGAIPGVPLNSIVVLLCLVVTARALPPNCELSLFLEGGLSGGKNIELDFTCGDGVISNEVWGYSCFNDKYGKYAAAYNAADYQGRIVSIARDGSRVRCTVDMLIVADPYSQPATARFNLDFAIAEPAVSGSFSGLDGLARGTHGTITGKVRAPMLSVIDEFVPLGDDEHPRLIFRRRDLPTLRAHMQTPEGRAILEQFDRTDSRPYIFDTGMRAGEPSFHLAGIALRYVLTNDDHHAAAARTLTEQIMAFPVGSMAELRRGRHYMGPALAFDMCYDAPSWDRAFRTRVAEWIRDKTLELAYFPSAKGDNPQPYSNHAATAMGCMGVMALSVLGEGLIGDDTSAQRLPSTPDSLEYVSTMSTALTIAVRSARRYFTIGVGDHGFGTEGDYFTRNVLVNAMFPFLQALKVSRGKVLSDVSATQWVLPYMVAKTVEGDMPCYGATPLDPSNPDHNAFITMGFPFVAPDLQPAVRWHFDKYFGLDGDGTFAVTWGQHAAYCLANYPFDGPSAQDPNTGMPHVIRDYRKGVFTFRKAWKDASDFVAVMNLKSEPLAASWQSTSSPAIKVWGAGERWPEIGIVDHPTANGYLGGKATSCRAGRDGSAVVSIDLSDAYLQGIGAEGGSGYGGYYDTGVRVHREFAIDYSGASGADALIVVADSFNDERRKTWRVKSVGSVSLGGAEFLMSSGNASMRATFTEPCVASLSGDTVVAALTERKFMVVLTIRQGSAHPAVSVVARDSLRTVIEVGGQRIVYADGRIHMKEFDGTAIAGTESVRRGVREPTVELRARRMVVSGVRRGPVEVVLYSLNGCRLMKSVVPARGTVAAIELPEHVNVRNMLIAAIRNGGERWVIRGLR